LPVVTGLLAVLLLANPARGEAPLPTGVPDLLGARGLSIGAYRGLAPGNDGMFTNAAALAARRRYAIETHWLLDRAGADNAFQVLTASAVDSEASVTGGFAYTRVLSGPWLGSLLHLPVAFPLAERLAHHLTERVAQRFPLGLPVRLRHRGRVPGGVGGRL